MAAMHPIFHSFRPDPSRPWAVTTAARYTPWESRCLAQAMVAMLMLKRCAVPSTLYLGLAKDAQTDPNAHAWLRCGDKIITGGPIHQLFTVIASFAAKFS